MTKPIVYIDDEAPICRAFGALLRHEGFVVETFTSPLTALEWLRDNEPSVVICDYRMPEMSGLDLLTRIGRELPFYVITGELVTEELGAPAGVTGVLQKPLRPETLFEIVRKHQADAI